MKGLVPFHPGQNTIHDSDNANCPNGKDSSRR